jgi:hypothetical protein
MLGDELAVNAVTLDRARVERPDVQQRVTEGLGGKAGGLDSAEDAALVE